MDSVVSLNVVTVEYPAFDDINFTLKKSLENNLKIFGYNHDVIGKTFRALEDISLEVKQGDRVGVIGLNGAGKTTLLRVLTGVFQPQSGSVTINGSVHSLIDISIGFAHELSGFENIQRRLCLMGIAKQQWKNYIDDIIQFADIGEFIFKPLATYSSGMQMRLAFSIATSVVPDLLVLDEIIGAGDVKFRERASRRLDEFMDKSRAIVISSHDLGLIKTFCNRCIFLMNGKIVLDGDPEACIEKYLVDTAA